MTEFEKDASDMKIELFKIQDFAKMLSLKYGKNDGNHWDPWLANVYFLVHHHVSISLDLIQEQTGV